MVRDVDAELRRFLAGEHIGISEVLTAISAKTDVDLAVGAVMAVIGGGAMSRCRRLPARVIRGVLAAQSPRWEHLFLRLAVDAESTDTELATAWSRAVEVLRGSSYRWGSEERRAKLAAWASDARLLAAAQGVVAHRADVRRDILAVLMIDGGDASFDALVTHLDAALVERDERIDLARSLRTHAVGTPRMRALFAEIEGAASLRNAASPVLAIATTAGLPAQSELWFHAMMSSIERRGGRAGPVRANLLIDSRRARCFRIDVTQFGTPRRGIEARATRFELGGPGADELGLGGCSPSQLGSWLVAAATTLGIDWKMDAMRSSLRGGKRQALATWLSTGKPAEQASRRR